jgi:hypothetical protein
MARASSPDDPETALDSDSELRDAWNHFRSGEVVSCPLDRAPLALAVDAAGGVYRFVCTACGAGSVWFESGPTCAHVPRGPSRRRSDDA